MRLVIFYGLQVFLTVVFGIIAVVIMPFSVRFRQKVMRYWTVAILWLLRVLCGLDYQVKGLEHIDKDQPVVIVSAHQSAWETLALQALFPHASFVLKRELLWIPFFGFGMAACSPIAIRRESPKAALKRLLSMGLERLHRGGMVVIYPEGTRKPVHMPGKFSIGAALLAQKAQVPLLPIAHNSGHFWRRQSIWKKPGCIQMVIGELIYPKDFNNDARAMNMAAEKWVHDQVRLLNN